METDSVQTAEACDFSMRSEFPLRDWDRIWRRINSSQKTTALAWELWPDQRPISFLDALDEFCRETTGSQHRLTLADELRGLDRQIRSAEQMARCPIVATLGMLNSGKSSLVAGFLSHVGRCRMPRGHANRDGTARFVFWVPASWKNDASVWSCFHGQLRHVFGQAAELLADDPTEAKQQYSNTNPDVLNVPLVATDTKLDEFRVGWLDCPDIQSGQSLHDLRDETTSLRLAFLEKAAPLCSAFVIVTSLSVARDRTVDRLVRAVGNRMPRLSRYLAINMIRPNYQTRDILDDFQDFCEAHGIQDCYAAYDLAIPDGIRFMPTQPDGFEPSDDGHPIPWFYAMRRDDSPETLSDVPGERYLHHLPGVLNFSEAAQRRHLDLLDRAKRVIRQAGGVLNARIQKDRELASVKVDILKHALAKTMTNHDGSGREPDLTTSMTRSLSLQICDAVRRTAPGYIRWRLTIGKKAGEAGEAFLKRIAKWFPRVSERFRRFTETALAVFRKKSQQRRKTFLDSLEQAGFLDGLPVGHGSAMSRSELPGRCNRIVTRFHEQSAVVYSQEMIDDLMKEMWDSRSAFRKVLDIVSTPVVMIMLFLAAMFAAIDGGTTFIGISVLEFVMVMGFTTLAEKLSSSTIYREAERVVALHQFSDLLAIACDELGLPRPWHISRPVLLKEFKGAELPESQLPQEVKEPRFWIAAVDEEAVSQLYGAVAVEREA